MELVRNCDFTSSHFGFDDAYGTDKDLTKIADRIIRAVTASPYKEAWVPLTQTQPAELTGDIVEAMHADDKVLYVLPDIITFSGYDPKYVFTDGSYTQHIGAVDKNIVILNIGADFTKDKLLGLLAKAGEAIEESKVADAKREYEKKQVQTFIDNRKKLKRVEVDRDLASAREQLKAASNQVIFQCRRIEDLQLMQLSYAEGEGENERIEAEIAELFASPMLSALRFDNDKVIFNTKDIDIIDLGGKVHPIGRFEVTITMSNSVIKFMNLANKLPKESPAYGIQHPHVNPEGQPCLGNVETVIPELIAKYDILGLWQISLSYLTSYNPADSWGKRLKYWPAYDKEGKYLGVELSLDAKPEEIAAGEAPRATWHCANCDEDHYADEIEEHICPVCGEHFCVEGEGDYAEYNGVYYCCTGCAEAQKLSEGVA